MKKRLLPITVLVLIVCMGLTLKYAYNSKADNARQSQRDYHKCPYYIDMMDDISYNVYEVIKAGNTYFEGRDKGKGSGYKQFQRWVMLNEDMFYPSGDRSNFNPLLPYEVRRMYDSYKVPGDRLVFEGVTTATLFADNWEEVGPAVELKTLFDDKRNGNGRIEAIWVNPSDSDHIYVGCRGGGFWATTDGGTNWSPKTDQLGITGVNSIAVNPTNTNEVYIATAAGGSGNYSIGIFKSTNGGNTWFPTSYALDIALDFTVINKLIIDPSNPQVLFAGTSKGLIKTTNGFQSYTVVLNGNILDIEFKPGDSNVVYVANSSDNTLYKSSDGGATFLSTGLTTTRRMQVAVSAAAPNNVYVSDDNYFARSTDNGLTFIDGGIPDAGIGQYGGFGVSDIDPLLIINGSIDAYRSENGGDTFSKATYWIYDQSTGVGGNFVHADIREVEVVNGTIYLGTDGWLVRSTDGGLNYDILTYSMGNHEVYEHGLGVSQADDNTLLVGVQDNGTSVLYDGVWHHWKGGDGGTSVADYSNKDILYGSLFNGDFKRTETGGKTNNNIDLGDTKPGGVPPLVQHPTEPATLFLGEGNGQVWKSTDKGANWVIIGDLGVSNVIDELAVATSDPNTIYTSAKNQLWKTTDGGANWTEITGSLPNLVIKGIAVDHNDPNHIAICYAGYSSNNKAFVSSDGGGNWTNISAGLPNLNTHDLVFQKSADDGLYLATDVGVYYRNNTATNWALYASGLPNSVVNDMEIQHATGYLYVATWGRGVWKAPVAGGSQHPLADFTANQTEININNTITFTDQSLNNPTSWSWSFPGGTPSTSTDQNPSVTYKAPGLYNVTLTVTNSTGSHTQTKSGYIEVNTMGTGEANLEVYYPFDDSTADFSGSGRHGAVSGSTVYENGIFGKAFTFNGGNSLTTSGYTGVLGSNQRTVAAWLKITSNGSIASWGGSGTANRFTFRVDGGKLRVEIAGSFIIGTTNVVDGQWHHVAITFANSTTPTLENITFYVDGQVDAVSSIGSLINVDTTEGSDVSLGVFPFGGQLQGAMDEFRLYSIALDASRIKELADPSIAGLVSRYEFSGNLVDDGSNVINAVSNYGTVTYTNDHLGVPSNAYEAPGQTGQYLTIPGYKGIIGNEARTVAAWIRTTEAGSRKTILAWGTNTAGQMFNLMVADNNVRIEGGASSLLSVDGTIEDNKWHHIAYTFDPTDGNTLSAGKIYIDGELQTNVSGFNHTATVLNTVPLEDVRIGDAQYNANYYFQGGLDDIRIYDRAITEQEINTIISTTFIDLVFNYGFDNNLQDSGQFNIDAVSNYGTVTYTNDHLGVPSNAYEAPGQTGQYLTIPGYKGIIGNEARTVAAWIRTTEAGSRKTILAWGTNTAGQMFNLMVADNNVRIEGGASSLLSVDGTIEDNKWHHIAYTFDPTDGNTLSAGKIYIDGELQTNVSGFNHTATVLNTVPLEDVRIGDAQYNANYYFQGEMENVALFNKALSASEIVELAGEFPEPEPEFPLSVRYPFEGNLDDISEYGRNAVTTGTPLYAVGPNGAGQAYLLDGTNALNIPGYSGELLSRDRTVATWIKTTQNGKVITNWGTATTGQKITLKTHSNGNLRLEVAGGFIVGSTSISDGQWHHVAFTFENDETPNITDAILYVDGIQDAISSSLSRTLNTIAGDDVQIGQDNFVGSTIGVIDDFRIYSVALSPEEIGLMATPPASGLVSDYTFNETLEDLGSNGITLVSNFGVPTYVADKNENEYSAWQAPGTTGTSLAIHGYKGILGNTSRTVSAWVKPETAGSRKTILSWGKNTSGKMFNFMVSEGEIRVEGGACNISTSGANLEDGKWHHIAYTFDANDGTGSVADGKLYVDGTLWIETTSYNGKTILNTAYGNDVLIGEAFYNSNYFFHGVLDDIRIYDYVVSAEELRNEFCNISEPIIVSVSAEKDTVYFGYEPEACTTLSIDELSGGYGNLSYVWSTGETTPTIIVCPEETTTYTLSVTDASGCQTTEAFTTVKVIDVHCGNNNDKVLICHSGKTLCIDLLSVPDHLIHGDNLSRCIDDIYKSKWNVNNNLEEIIPYPNPFIDFITVKIPDNGKQVKINLYDVSGALIKSVYKKGDEINIDTKNISQGLYFLEIIINGEKSNFKLIKTK